MKIACDRCGKLIEDSLLQIDQEEGGEILYLCPECYQGHQGEPPEEQA